MSRNHERKIPQDVVVRVDNFVQVTICYMKQNFTPKEVVKSSGLLLDARR